MTTNAGASDMAREGVGFGNISREGEDEEAVKRMFTPEFRNRLDAIVPFSYLGRSTVARVVDKFILVFKEQLKLNSNITESFDRSKQKQPKSKPETSKHSNVPLPNL